MNKYNFFTKLIKKKNLSTNSLFKKYLNKLKFNSPLNLQLNKTFKKLNKLNLSDFLNIAKSNKFFLSFVALTIICLSYLSVPNIYDKAEINKELKNQLFDKFNVNFNFPKNTKYSFFPRPHFTIKNSSIQKDQKEISKIKDLKIYVTLNNLFSLKNMEINDLIIEKANFNLDNKNYNFFTNLLGKDFKNISFKIKDSNIFYRNQKKEVLFINKIKKMNYYYDSKNLMNIVNSQNEIFNVPYSLELRDNKINKTIFSKLVVDSLKLRIEDEIDYSSDIIKGFTNLTIYQKKRNATYEVKTDNFIFNFFDKSNNSKLLYKGEIIFKPFYSNFTGIDKEIDLSFLFNSNSLFSGLLKSNILNNRNLNVNLFVNADKVQNYNNFMNIFLNSKIEEGLIDLDDTKFTWKDLANFKISNSLLYVKDNQLILDGKLDIVIDNSSEIYQSFLTPKNYRLEIDKIDFNFNYNFDLKILSLSDIKINNEISKKLNTVLKSLTFRNDKLQNKIYFKNTINKAIKAYAG